MMSWPGGVAQVMLTWVGPIQLSRAWGSAAARAGWSGGSSKTASQTSWPVGESQAAALTWVRSTTWNPICWGGRPATDTTRRCALP